MQTQVGARQAAPHLKKGEREQEKEESMYVYQEGTAADLDPVETDLMSFIFFIYIFQQSLGSLIYKQVQ